MKETSYNKIVRLSAWYDLIITTPFAFPLLSTIHKKFGFTGEIPEFLPTHFLFMNLMGSIVIVWSDTSREYIKQRKLDLPHFLQTPCPLPLSQSLIRISVSQMPDTMSF